MGWGRWAAAGVLDRWLVAVSGRPLGQDPDLSPIAAWLRRAWRRMSRLLPQGSIALAKALGRSEAWPAPSVRLPNPALSETGTTLAQLSALSVNIASLALVRSAARLLRAGQRLIRLARGNRHEWRLK
jgi:hypothetical protein